MRTALPQPLRRLRLIAVEVCAVNSGVMCCRPMINKLPPCKGLNIRIPIKVPIEGRVFINHGLTVVWPRWTRLCLCLLALHPHAGVKEACNKSPSPKPFCVNPEPKMYSGLSAPETEPMRSAAWAIFFPDPCWLRVSWCLGVLGFIYIGFRV